MISLIASIGRSSLALLQNKPGENLDPNAADLKKWLGSDSIQAKVSLNILILFSENGIMSLSHALDARMDVDPQFRTSFHFVMENWKR